jgi:putative heme-binding domain-containing protein
MRLRATLLCGALLWPAGVWAQAPTVKLDDAAVIARGNSIFATTCGIGYCHGKEGRAGRGPRLAGRKLDKHYLFKTISNGVNNSLMPAFKSQLSADEIWSVVAYILSLSGGPGASAAPGAPETPHKTTEHVKPSNPNDGDPEADRALFFDASNPQHCAVCHQFQSRGADAGPDLTAAGAKPAREILRDIVEPDARLAVEPVTITTKSGQRFTGLKKQETRELIRVYDMTTLPPVLRTIYKDQVRSITPERHSPMPGNYGRLYTRKQLLDLVAFLRSAPVSREEVGSPK